MLVCHPGADLVLHGFTSPFQYQGGLSFFSAESGAAFPLSRVSGIFPFILLQTLCFIAEVAKT